MNADQGSSYIGRRNFHILGQFLKIRITIQFMGFWAEN
jgi:hypothetical protein